MTTRNRSAAPPNPEPGREIITTPDPARSARSAGARVSSLALVLLLCSSSGCVQLAGLWANISGGDVVDPEYKLTQGPLLVLIEDPRGDVAEPRVLRELHATISENFLEFKVNNKIIPWEERERLERANKDYAKFSVREIGEKLGAEQVLYIRVDKFSLQTQPGAPIFQGEFVTRVKVLATKQEREVRLWPREASGRRFAVTTKPVSSEGEKTASDVAKELAIKMGQTIAQVFYEHRSFDEPKK